VIARGIAALLIVGAVPAVAQNQPADLVHFMGGHGCTFGQQSIAAAEQAGFPRADVDAAMAAYLADSTGRRQGDYVVLDETLCTIRLPDIHTDLPLSHPDILAITTDINAFAKDGSPGCFLADATSWFQNSGRTFDDYTRFLATHIIAGDVRFFSTSPLRTPVSFQVISQGCSKIPDIDAMRANHAKLVAGFGAFVRHQGATKSCNRSGDFIDDIGFAMQLQGADPAAFDVELADVNAWLWMEYLMIALAADWIDGDTWTEKGSARPPMCHY
jgi:hypothetical protein